MNNILHSPKPKDTDQWLLDGESRQRFYEELITFLCVEVARPSSTLPARFWPEIGTHGMKIQ
jgi:lipid-A-disaccharide synthase-like uncharacterized protein